MAQLAVTSFPWTRASIRLGVSHFPNPRSWQRISARLLVVEPAPVQNIARFAADLSSVFLVVRVFLISPVTMRDYAGSLI